MSLCTVKGSYLNAGQIVPTLFATVRLYQADITGRLYIVSMKARIGALKGSSGPPDAGLSRGGWLHKELKGHKQLFVRNIGYCRIGQLSL